jgi:hypothetical protein
MNFAADQDKLSFAGFFTECKRQRLAFAARRPMVDRWEASGVTTQRIGKKLPRTIAIPQVAWPDFRDQ